MPPRRSIRLALDQNFPTPILAALAEFIVDIDLIPLRKIDQRLSTLDDRTLVIALQQLGFEGLVTNNYKMLKNRRSWQQSSPQSSRCSPSKASVTIRSVPLAHCRTLC